MRVAALLVDGVTPFFEVGEVNASWVSQGSGRSRADGVEGCAMPPFEPFTTGDVCSERL